MIRSTLAAAAVMMIADAMGGSLALAQSESTQSDITITAPRAGERSPTTGAPIETVTTSRIVSYRDLDLSTAAGKQELDKRVKTAARRACDWLDQMHPIAAQGSPDCLSTAVNSAKDQVDAAVMAANQPR